MAPGLTPVSTMATTPFIGPKTAAFPVEQCKDPPCLQPASTVGTWGSDYSFSRNGFVFYVALTDGEIQKLVSLSLRARLPHTYPYAGLAGFPFERSM